MRTGNLLVIDIEPEGRELEAGHVLAAPGQAPGPAPRGLARRFRQGRARVVTAAACVFVALAGGAARAEAHAVGVSRGTWTFDGTSLSAALTLARGEAVLAAPLIDADGDGRLSGAELDAGRDMLAAAVLSGITLTVPGGSCSPGRPTAHPVEGDGVEIDAVFTCPESASATVELPLLSRLSQGHRHLAQVAQGDDGVVVVSATQATFAVARSGAAPGSGMGLLRRAGSFIRLGAEHVLTGWDHLLFLLGLVLAGGRPRTLAAVITAFTVGHSISLALAVAGGWSPSPRLVEPAIALSIAWVGLEALRGTPPSGRWRITLPFGLVHGFGFAGALREIALPPGQLPLALGAFNVGVEVGQLAALAVLLPCLWLLRKRERLTERVVPAIAAALVATGLAVFVVRVVRAAM